MKKVLFIIVAFLTLVNFSSAQEKVFQTFKDTRVVNGHSVETLKAHRLDFRVTHRFGDFAGDLGGWQSFYGLENSTDVGIEFDYGVSDNFMVGLMRTKGAGPIKQLVSGFAKIKLVGQEVNGKNPLTMTVLALASYSTMPKSENEGRLNYFAKSSHRLAYHLEFLMARKLSNAFSLQVTGAWTYRNIVTSDDQNDLPSLSAALKWQCSKSFGFLLESRYMFSSLRTSENNYFPEYGFGFEWETGGGHVFQLNLTNSTGIVETDYIPYTTSDISKGQFRIGFTISRQFRL
ncbi:MAG TPA: DUF5777 family beta-barrel protein [Saprospiraceae bacterium]|nr:hypothetical protein [Saprospiraceae bacterium]MCB9328169.1 hypothetical protein [Lewinellaceae bacterium]HPK09329.1 DUF5777 family beta-barrel protein [Saprospiraceae bacterium]HPQ21626.1 DUF5777 family beta-barrel protein [Saprospiraceae bacterium]HRX29384.1 DUF5777 family beta-barrel protein [Saprospiraceae bacterium]